MSEDIFWIHHLPSLWASWNIVPSNSLSFNSLLNTFTRLILILGVLLLIIGFAYWWAFILIGLVVIFGFYSWKIRPPPMLQENYQCPAPPGPKISRFRGAT